MMNCQHGSPTDYLLYRVKFSTRWIYAIPNNTNVHAYIPHLLEDIKAAHRTEKMNMQEPADLTDFIDKARNIQEGQHFGCYSGLARNAYSFSFVTTISFNDGLCKILFISASTIEAISFLICK